MAKLDIHAIAKSSVNEMRRMCKSYPDASITEFREAQMVHMMAKQLEKTQKYWVALEYRYPHSRENGEQTFERCDLVAWSRATKKAGGNYIWIETKVTGLRDDGNYRNSFSRLGWKEDFKKFRSYDDRHWNAHHSKYWVWLYLFNNYRKSVQKTLGFGSGWKDLSEDQIASVFPSSKDSHVVKMGNLIQSIRDNSISVLLSCIPNVDPADTDTYSALLVSATFTE